METRPDIISSNCPYCLTMLTDAVKDMNLEEKVQVKDITELLMEASADAMQQAENPAQV